MVTVEKPYTQQKTGSDPMIVFNQEKVWAYQLSTVRIPLFLVVQLLERRDEYSETEDAPAQDLTREYLDKVYRMLGYGVVQLNEEGTRN